MRSFLTKIILFSVLAFFYVPLWSSELPAILVVGDSISAGYGMKLDESWPRLLQNRLNDQGHHYHVVNSSITGDTTQGGLARLPRLLNKYQPELVIIELGGNDGLRGISILVTRQNLAEMIEKSLAANAEVILTGIRLPPNYGPTYTEGFYATYIELEGKYDVSLVPFLMEGIALKPGLMQDDGIHPNAEAQPLLLDNVWESLSPALD